MKLEYYLTQYMLIRANSQMGENGIFRSFYIEFILSKIFNFKYSIRTKNSYNFEDLGIIKGRKYILIIDGENLFRFLSKKILFILKKNHFLYSTYKSGNFINIMYIVARKFTQEVDQKLAVPIPFGLRKEVEISYRLNHIINIKGIEYINN